MKIRRFCLFCVIPAISNLVNRGSLHWICSVPVATSISFIGIIGNLLAIIIWNRLRLILQVRGNVSSAITLIALSVFGIGLLIFFLLTEAIPVSYPEVNNNYYYAAFYSWVGYPGYYIFTVASIWMVVFVTLNRVMLVMCANKAKSLCTNQRTIIIIIVMLILSFLTNIPHFFKYSPSKKCGLQETPFGRSKISKEYHFWVHCVCLVLAPWLIIACSNIVIIRKVFRQGKPLGPAADQRNWRCFRISQEGQMVVTLLTVTITFLLLLAVECLSRCFYLQNFGKREDKATHTWRIVKDTYSIANLGLVLHASLNCFLYCLTGTMFKKELWRTFSRIKMRACSVLSLLTFHRSKNKRDHFRSEIKIVGPKPSVRLRCLVNIPNSPAANIELIGAPYHEENESHFHSICNLRAEVDSGSEH